MKDLPRSLRLSSRGFEQCPVSFVFFSDRFDRLLLETVSDLMFIIDRNYIVFCLTIFSTFISNVFFLISTLFLNKAIIALTIKTKHKRKT
jgi:hypothetical protein